MRRFVITAYTTRKLRDRLRAHGRKELLKLADEPLRDLLDKAVGKGMDHGLVQSFKNNDGEGYMVDVTDALGCELWAFTRPDRTRESRGITGKWAVVTVMDHAFVDRLNALGGLGKVSIEDAKEIAKAPLEDTEPRLITYRNKDAKPCTAECLAKDVVGVIRQLSREGAGTESFRVWRPAKVKAQLVVNSEG
jgi:hypothetical protein